MEIYQLKVDGEWYNVSKMEFILAERAAGFKPKYRYNSEEYWNVCATGGFTTSGIKGRIL